VAWLGPGRVVRHAVIRVDGGEVAYAGPERRAPPAVVETIEVDGFLMPAVADRHVHIGLSSVRSVLAGGVTAVRDLAWPPEEIFPVADASESTSFHGPLVRAAGPMLTAPGGYPTRSGWAPPGTGLELRGPDHATSVVDSLAARGAAHIKVSLNAEAGPTPTDAELSAVVAAARRHGLPVTAHPQGKGQAERALGSGIVELAHTPWTERLGDALLHAMARAGLRMVSTLDIHSYGHDTPAVRTALDNLRRFHRAGGDVVYGTDLGNGPIPPGIHVGEARLLAEAGLTREEVLAAMALGPLDAGAPADIIAFTSDPLEDLKALEGVKLVMRAGAIRHPA
jgi:imidazolonepropionase-like amidohydrolase